MKIKLIILLLISITSFNIIKSQSSIDEITQEFFKIYEKSPTKAIDYAFSTNQNGKKILNNSIILFSEIVNNNCPARIIIQRDTSSYTQGAVINSKKIESEQLEIINSYGKYVGYKKIAKNRELIDGAVFENNKFIIKHKKNLIILNIKFLKLGSKNYKILKLSFDNGAAYELNNKSFKTSSSYSGIQKKIGVPKIKNFINLFLKKFTKNNKDAIDYLVSNLPSIDSNTINLLYKASSIIDSTQDFNGFEKIGDIDIANCYKIKIYITYTTNSIITTAFTFYKSHKEWKFIDYSISIKDNSKSEYLEYEPEILKMNYKMIRDLTLELSPRLTDSDKKDIKKIYSENEHRLDNKKMTIYKFIKFIYNLDVKTKFDGSHNTFSASVKLSDKLFPIPINIFNNNFIINSSHFEIPFGSVILSINGSSSPDIIKKINVKSRNKALRKLEKSFFLKYFLEYGISNSFQVKYKRPNSELIEYKIIKSCSFLTIFKNYNNSVFPLEKELYNKDITGREYPEINCSYIMFNTFDGDHETYTNAFDSIFKNIKDQNSKSIIIDLRYNNGGYPLITSLFFTYISKNNFNNTMTLTTTQNLIFPYPENIVKISDKKISSPKDIERFVKMLKTTHKKVGKKYVETLDDKIYKPKSNAFKGDVYLLVGEGTSSAAIHFTALFKSENRGIIIGDTLARHRYQTAGHSLTYQLPETKLKITLPIMCLVPSNEILKKVPEDRIIPDILISDSVRYEYFLKRQDPELEEVLKLIKKRFKK